MPITLDLTSDFSPTSRPPPPQQRTLLLAPPSLAASATRLPSLFTSGAFSRATTDLHMLDRLAAGLVTLPPSTYDLVLVLAGDDATPQLDRALWALIVPAVKPGGKVSAEDGRLSKDSVGTLAEAREGVLAGMVAGEDGFVKPEGWGEEEEAVPIVFGLRGKKKKENVAPPPVQAPQPPKGVGFIDFSDDLDLDADDDDLIDEETLLTDADLRRPVPQPPECAPQPGKKRRACKDCTCGLAERKFYPHIIRLSPCWMLTTVDDDRPRSRRQAAPRQGGQGPRRAQARVGGPQRAGFHRPGQDGVVQFVLFGGRVSVCWYARPPASLMPVVNDLLLTVDGGDRLPLHGPAGVQAGRGGQDPG